MWPMGLLFKYGSCIILKSQCKVKKMEWSDFLLPGPSIELSL